MKEQWERQKGERDKAFHLFTLYRDMGPLRTIPKVQQEYKKLTGNTISIDMLYKYSGNYSWKERTSAYDDHIDELTRIEQEEAIKEMVQRHANNSETLQDKIMELLNHPDVTNTEEPMSASKLAWLLLTTTNSYEKAALLERLSRGEPTENITEQHTGFDDLAKAIDNSRKKIQEND